MFILYNVLFFLGFLFLSPYYLWRMCRRGGYAKDFGQRFGFYSPEVRQQLNKGNAIWIHSVSVGETHAVTLVAQRLRELFPDALIVWSTTTSTGYAEIHSRKPGGAVPLYYPVDFPWIVNRALQLIRPRALILAESEIWPNMIRTLAQRNVPIALINAKISPRSHRRYLKLGKLARETFGRFSLVAAQEPGDVERLSMLGIARDRIQPVGSLKFDAAIPQTAVARFDPWIPMTKLGVQRGQPILLGGSTWPGEEDVLFDILRELRADIPDLFLILVPRHAERTPEVVQAAKQKQVRFALRTAADSTGPVECLIVNTTGELRSFYEAATVVFVGKSLFVVEKSLQNPIEPAALGKPVIVGPNIESFDAIVKKFLTADAMVQIRDATGLKTEVHRLLQDAKLRDIIGVKAAHVVEQNRGAVEKTVKLLAKLLGG